MAGLVPVLTISVLISLACADSTVDPSPTGTATNLPTAALISTQEPAPVHGFDDPRELASFLIDRAKNNDWDAVRTWLGDDFRRFDDHTIQRSVGDQLLFLDVSEPRDWGIEEHEAFTTVRLTDVPTVALNFRYSSDGDWRYDPGPHALYMAALWEQDPELQLAEPAYSAWERQLNSDVEPRQILERFGDSLSSSTIRGNIATVTLEWSFRRNAGAEVPLSGLQWTAGDASGSVQVVWTTAVVTNDHVAFPPPPPAFSESVSQNYAITFQLQGLHGGEELYLQIDRMTLDAPTSGALTLSIGYRLPKEDYPQPAN